VNIISRADWGARAPRDRTLTTWAQRTEVIVHHSEGPVTQSVRSIQDFHMDDRGWDDIGYNFLVDHLGRAYEGRGWLTVGAHAVGHNTSGIGVCVIGSDGPDITAAALATVRELYDEACRRAGRTLPARGHGDVNPTDCPGDVLRAWVHAGMPATTKGDPLIGLSQGDEGEPVIAVQRLILYAGATLPKYGVDGQWGEETSEGLLQVRKMMGTSVTSATKMTGTAYAQLMAAVARKQGNS